MKKVPFIHLDAYMDDNGDSHGLTLTVNPPPDSKREAQSFEASSMAEAMVMLMAVVDSYALWAMSKIVEEEKGL